MANEETNDTGYGCNMKDRTLSKAKGAWKTLLVMRKFIADTIFNNILAIIV